MLTYAFFWIAKLMGERDKSLERDFGIVGFTLIELSIVLVIIGLIVGGVLVGRDLINAAHVRAQISQIEKYQTAVNTFYGKYQALPGDMNYATAATFGFSTTDGTTTRGNAPGEGDGNGMIESCPPVDLDCSGADALQAMGETGFFWSDLTYANGMNINLIEGSYGRAAAPLLWASGPASVTATEIPLYFPTAKIGNGNYVYVYNSILSTGITTLSPGNFFALVGINSVTNGGLNPAPSITVLQASRIDAKLDDGFPYSGRVQAYFVSGDAVAHSTPYMSIGPILETSATCVNVAGGPGTVGSYDIDALTGNGNNANCALSFQFQ